MRQETNCLQFSPDWGSILHRIGDTTFERRQRFPKTGDRDRSSIGPKLQEEESLLQATHSERGGKGQGRAKHLAATKFQAGAADLVIVNG